MRTPARLLILDLACLLAAVVILTFTWRDTLLCTAAFAGLVCARFALAKSRRALVLFALGFVGASVAEIVQVAAGLYTYTVPGPLLIPWYNFFFWGVIFLAAAQLLAALEARFAAERVEAPRREVALELSGYVAITTLLCALPRQSQVLALTFAAVLVARLWFSNRRADLAFVGVGMVLGPATEAWLVACGIYRFSDPALFGLLPWWHPIYWGLITLFLRRLTLSSDLARL